jgi:plasmid stabilization system protein ParE
MYKVLIAEPAEHDLRSAFEWWRDNRSAEQAARWYRGIHEAIASLRIDPTRCAPSPESDLLPQGMWQLLFGIGRRATHRVVFTIEGETVTILRVRHSSQDALQAEDIG